MANVLVLNPASQVTKNVIRDVLYGCWCKGKRIGGGSVPPWALLSVATILKQDGNNVEFLDAQAEQKSFEEIANKINDVDILIISTSTMSFIEDAKTLLDFKKIKPSLTTIVFGSHPTFMPNHALKHPGVDIILRHEPEFVVRDLIRSVNNNTNGAWQSIKGIGFKVNGSFTINPEYPFIDLEQIPFPDVTMLPKDIHYYNPLVRRMPYITTTTSKGCPAQCSFCTAPYFDGMKYRYQSADYVVREIEYFLENGFKEVYFRDDTFFVKKDRDIKICEEIIKRDLDVSWIANSRVSMIDKDMMQLAKDAGCHTIKFGIESGVQEILDRMRKGYKVEQAYRVFEWINEVGIHAHAHVMLGNPGDSLETVNQTIEYVKELAPATATFGLCTPYPGTPLFQEVAEVYPEIADGTDSNLSKLHVEGIFNELYTNMTKEELDECVRHAYREFYLRPSYFFKTVKKIRNLDDIKRISIAAANVVDFAIRGE